MKKPIITSILVAILALNMLPTTVFALTEDTTETILETYADDELNNEQEQSTENENSSTNYEVTNNDELAVALEQIATSTATEAVIVLKNDVVAPSTPEDTYVTSFGVAGKHITVKSEDGEMKKLSFSSRGILTGDCTFDNIDVIGSRLYCNGYRTIFTENGQIHLSETLYGGGYKTTVNSTYVVIASTGYINPSSSSGLHNVIGGSYQGSVEGDTYIEIIGNIKFQAGNHITPGCIKGDGSSGDGAHVANVYVGGNATLIYDNKNTDTYPAIEGTYGCEMKGNVTLDVRAGGVLGIVGTEEPVDESIIRGDLHIIAGSPNYENTDQVLCLGGNWPIVGAGHSFATMPGAVGNYAINGNIVIDTYENVWAWDKGTNPTSYDLPEIYGAIRGDVGGNITINAHGSHVQNIFGASDSNVQGSVTVTATDVELKNSEYNTKYDEGYIFGLWEKGIPSTSKGSVTVTVNDGDVGLVMVTDQTTAPAGSSINVTGKPKIRTGIRGTQASSYSTEFPIANVQACETVIPFVKGMSQVNITGNSNVKVHTMTNNAGLLVEEGSTLTTDQNQVYIWGNTIINGTWEQLHSQTTNYNDIFISGTTQIGSTGHLINHGTSNLKGAVTNDGVMALMGWALLQNNYASNNGELRLPTVAVGANYDTGTIPVQINGLSTGTTTVNTVDPADWNTLKKPMLGDNYILSQKNTDAPAQEVFLLGNEDAILDNWYLKRMNDADGTDDYYMWQVAKNEIQQDNKIHYEWISTDNPTDVLPPQDEHIRKGTEYTSQKQKDTAENYIFDGWFTDEDCSNKYIDGTTLDTDITLYGKWTAVYGNLTVNKKVAGTDGDKNQEFNFKVTLSKPVNGTYGDMTFTDGVANFTLKHDESKKGVNLPANISYTVVEDDYYKDGYTTTSINSTGTITKDKTTEVNFTNTKNKKEVKEDKVENNKPTPANVTTNYQLVQTDTK